MLPVQVTIRDLPNSQALENHIRDRAKKLTQFYQRINSCHIVVEISQKHKHQGKLFNVRIDVTVPGKELVVNRKLNEDIYIAIRDAFHAIERQIESYAHRQRGYVKKHESVDHGKIIRLFPEEGVGFIRGSDGGELYFSSASVAFPHFNKLMIGDVVQFLVSTASEGLQAQRVTLAKHMAHSVEEI